MNNKIIIIVKGGMIQSVYVNSKDIDVEVLDHDVTECRDDEALTEYNKQNEEIQAEIQNMYEVY
jgi:hypothetical protein